MSTSYVPISWNPFKKQYDLILGSILAFYLILFIGLNVLIFPQLILVTIIIRAFGTLALILLHIILMIGPLTRLKSKFLPLLYNRRHLGVIMFMMASVHAILSLIWFHSNGYIHPLISLFASNTHYDSFRFFPFQPLGFLAYLILMIMAFTSHDFWLHFLSPKVWKGLHMMVYFAYFLVIMHVMLGIIQFESSPLLFIMLMIGLVALTSLHIASGWKEWMIDHKKNIPVNGKKDHKENAWIYVCELNQIKENSAKMVILQSERVAIFKYGHKLSAVHNVCKHQNGPLGEGRIVDGCIVCPWHGYQYKPEDGCAPAPFTEKLATYLLKLEGASVYINVNSLPEGTYIEPLSFTDIEINLNPGKGRIVGGDSHLSPFFIGYTLKHPELIMRFINRTVIALVLLVSIIAIGFTLGIKHVANSSFDYDHLKRIQGQLISFPFPGLRTMEGKDSEGKPNIHTYPLVNDSKFGADGIVDSIQKIYNSKTYLTQITGAFIIRDRVSAMELSNKDLSVKVLNQVNNLPLGELKKIRDTSLIGEIIDPKCYLGAMNPGEGKPHRSCAILCIGGGIMPMLYFKNSKGEKEFAVLLGENGEKINHQVLRFVAEPVKIKGTLYKYDNWYVFYTNPNKNIKPLFY